MKIAFNSGNEWKDKEKELFLVDVHMFCPSQSFRESKRRRGDDDYIFFWFIGVAANDPLCYVVQAQHRSRAIYSQQL